MISVVIPFYNRKKQIKRALRSVLMQKCSSDIEVILVDDNSTDDYQKDVELQKLLKDQRVRLLVSNKNRGASASRNLGVKKSSGQYIVFLDSDDEMLPGRIVEQVKAIEKEEADFAICNCIYFYEDSGRKKIAGEVNTSNSILVLDVNLLINDLIPKTASTMIARKEALIEIPFDEDLPSSNDFDLILRMISQKKCIYINKVLSRMYKSSSRNRISNNYSKKIRGFTQVLSKIKKGVYKLNKTDRVQLELKFSKEKILFLALNRNRKDAIKLVKKISPQLSFKDRVLFNILPRLPMLLKIAIFVKFKV